jgi:ubiquitin carboxyl-terminal hydrolase 4/11/15
MQEKALELHPPHIKVLILDKHVLNENQCDPGPVLVTVSSADSIRVFLETLVSAVRSDAKMSAQQSRVWRLPTDTYLTRRLSISTFVSRGATILSEKEPQTVSDAAIESDDAFAVEFADENGKWLVDTDNSKSFPQKKTSFQISSQSEAPPLFSPENNFFDRMAASSSTSNLGSSSSYASSSKLKSALQSATPVNTFGSGPSSASASRYKHSQDPGTLGLGNMYIKLLLLWVPKTNYAAMVGVIRAS